MDDIAVIEAFAKAAIAEEDLLLSNPSFRIETSFNTIQLLTVNEGLIATSKHGEKPLSVAVNHRSSYWELLHQTLLTLSFVPTGETQKDFYRYQYCTAPQGYRLECTQAMDLWRAWWGSSHRNRRKTIPLELLIQRRGTWYPVKDIITSHGALYIKTLGSELTLHGSDLVVWLKQEKAG
jgi:hypothetical protein